MESRATPDAARRLLGIAFLPVAANRSGPQWRRRTVVLLLALALGVQPSRAGGCPVRCSCLPRAELASCVGLSAVPTFSGHSPRVLRITQHRITKLTSEALRGLERLEELQITDGRLFEISHDAFSSLTHLKKVNLSHNELAVLPRDSFASSPQLEELDLSWNPLVLPGRSPMLASKSLSALDMSSCSLSKLPDQVFSLVPSLSELRLRGNNLREVSACVLDPLKDIILVDADPTVEWVRCAPQEATTGGSLRAAGPGPADSGSTRVPPTDHGFTFAQMEFIPSLAQWIFLTVSALVVVLLLACIRKECKPEERRKEHKYEILGGSQAAYLATQPFTDFRKSRISASSCETFSDSTRVSVGYGESGQYMPHYFPPVPALHSKIPLVNPPV